jgi:hypothetical protein
LFVWQSESEPQLLGHDDTQIDGAVLGGGGCGPPPPEFELLLEHPTAQTNARHTKKTKACCHSFLPFMGTPLRFQFKEAGRRNAPHPAPYTNHPDYLN